MVKAQDLRLGNWLQNGEDVIEIVKGEAIDYIASNIELYKPIPLTPEILEKAGFRLQPQRISIYIKGRVKLWLGNNGVIAYLKNEDTDESYYIPNNPQSLHQLQNLYYALTGTELEINL